jgi:hypothetical protein
LSGTITCVTPPKYSRDKGHVEAGVKVVTNWVIHYLEGRVFTSLDELNAPDHRLPMTSRQCDQLAVLLLGEPVAA